MYPRYVPVFGSLVRGPVGSSICRELHALNAPGTCANLSKCALVPSAVAPSNHLSPRVVPNSRSTDLSFINDDSLIRTG